jgi:hypothetical protein
MAEKRLAGVNYISFADGFFRKGHAVIEMDAVEEAGKADRNGKLAYPLGFSTENGTFTPLPR